MDKDKIIGNATTIIKCASMIVAGAGLGLTASHGLNLPWTESQVAEAITTIVFTILAYYDARYPNTILDKTNKESQVTIVTTDELSEAIQQATQETQTQEERVDEVDVGDDQQ